MDFQAVAPAIGPGDQCVVAAIRPRTFLAILPGAGGAAVAVECDCKGGTVPVGDAPLLCPCLGMMSPLVVPCRLRHWPAPDRPSGATCDGLDTSAVPAIIDHLIKNPVVETMNGLFTIRKPSLAMK